MARESERWQLTFLDLVSRVDRDFASRGDASTRISISSKTLESPRTQTFHCSIQEVGGMATMVKAAGFPLQLRKRRVSITS
jgi:hypothetical protein